MIYQFSFVLGFSLVVCGACILGCGHSGPTSGFSQTVSQFEKNRHHSIDLPISSRDLNFLSRLDFTAVDFLINEKDFLTWAEKEKWSVQKISKPITSLRASKGGNIEAVIVTNGWSFGRHRSNGGGIDVIYDLQLGRCSVYYGIR